MPQARTLLAVALAALVAAPVLAVPAGAGAPTTFDAQVPSFDGHLVPVTVYLADGGAPAPVLLWGHGWAGNRGSAAGTASFFAEHGYHVVAMDFRGHGEARWTSQARVHDADVEIRDVMAVIDWVAAQEWALLEKEGDPVLGALGGSYGGGYQLLAAAFDDRLDAIAPEITWNHLPTSLAPGGAVKSAWVDLLYAGGVAQAHLDPLIHQAFAWAMTFNELPDGALPGEPDALSLFEKNSPASYADAITVPAFLVQGTSDTLFNYNQAAANAAQVAAAQQAAGLPVKVKLMTHLGGHVANTQGTVPGGFPATGVQAPAGGSPCGSVNEAVLAWYDHVLKGEPDALPDAQQALDDGTCLVGGATASAATTRTGPVPVPQAAPVASGHPHLLGQRADVPALRVPLDGLAAGDVVAGVPTFSAKATVVGGDAIVYFSVVKTGAPGGTRIVNDQVTPARLGPGAHDLALDLGGVGTRLAEGESLWLQVSSFDLQFAHNGERLPGLVVLEDLRVTVPVA